MKSYDAISVARYALSKSEMSNLRLQKTLYFIQVLSLLKKGTPIFNDKIEAWQYGPVVPNVYRVYRFSSYDKLSFDPKNVLEFYQDTGNSYLKEQYESYYKISKDKEVTDIIDETIEIFSKFEDWDLVKITHSYQVWKNARNNKKDCVMYVKDIKKYHKNINGFNANREN